MGIIMTISDKGRQAATVHARPRQIGTARDWVRSAKTVFYVRGGVRSWGVGFELVAGIERSRKPAGGFVLNFFVFGRTCSSKPTRLSSNSARTKPTCEWAARRSASVSVYSAGASVLRVDFVQMVDSMGKIVQ